MEGKDGPSAPRTATEMGEPAVPAGRGRRTPGRRILAALLVLAAGLAAAALIPGALGLGGRERRLIPYTVHRADLPITVTERGNLVSQDEVIVICEVDDIEGDGVHGTPIQWIVANGTSVKKDDLLVEFASAAHQERLDRQILGTEKARAEQIQARVKFDNQKTQNETRWAEAKLKVDLAELALKQFEDEDGGTFQIDLQAVELQIQEAQAGQLIEQTNLAGVEQLYKLGYRSSGELAQARLNALRAERQLATAISKRKELVEYLYLKTKMELQGQVASAKRALEQVVRDNDAFLEQARATMEAANQAMLKEDERLARYREQVTKCKIFAPQDGMVAYAVATHSWYREEIREGAAVRPQQRILTLPNLRKMQVKTAVHESVLDQIALGLPATIRVDAFPDRVYRGTVTSVAVLPDPGSWMSSDTKVYETIVRIDQEVEQIKPGMTAVVEIHIDRLEGVLSIPVQAIVQIEGESWCYLLNADGVERRTLRLGLTNDKFVEIREGVDEGARVVLNPMAIAEDGRRRESQISPEGREAGQRPAEAAAKPASG